MFAQTSFVATPGSIDAIGQIEMSSTKNYEDGVVYTFKFQVNGMVPPSGKVIIKIPEEVGIAQISQSQECLQSQCQVDLEERSVTIELSEEIEKGQEVQLSVGGLKNPRTFAPTNLFYITTIDSDA